MTTQTYRPNTSVRPNLEKFHNLRNQKGLTQEAIWERVGRDENQYRRFNGTAAGCSGYVHFLTLQSYVKALSELGNFQEPLIPEDFVLGLAPKGKTKPSEDRVEADSIPGSKDVKGTGEQGKRDEPSVSVDVSGIWSKRATTLAIGVLASILLCAGIAAFIFVPRAKNRIVAGGGNHVVVGPPIQPDVGAGVQVVQKPPLELPPVVAPVPTNFDQSGSLRDARAPFVKLPPEDDKSHGVNDYDFYAGRGIRHWQTGDYNNAALAFGEALLLRDTDEKILILFAEATRLSSLKDGYASRVEAAMKMLDAGRARLSDDDPWVIPLEITQGKSLAALGKMGEAVAIVDAARLQLVTSRLSGSEKITYYLDIAEIFQLNGDTKTAEDYIQKARDLAALIPSEEWSKFWCDAYLAWTNRESSVEAPTQIKVAIDWASKQPLPNDRFIAHLRALHAEALTLNNHNPEAKKEIALALKWAKGASDKRTESIWRLILANILSTEGENLKANVELDAAIAWQESQLPKDERSIAIMQASYANSLLNASDYPGALNKIDKAILWGESSDQSNLLEAWYRTKAAIYRWMATSTSDAKLDQESLDKAIAEHKKSLAIIDKSDHFRMFLSLMQSARLHQLDNEIQLALDEVNSAEAEIRDEADIRDRVIPGADFTPLQLIQARKEELRRAMR